MSLRSRPVRNVALAKGLLARAQSGSPLILTSAGTMLHQCRTHCVPWSTCPDLYFIPLRGVVQARCARSCSCGNAEPKDEKEAGKDTTLRRIFYLP